jgi:hypothetical protein
VIDKNNLEKPVLPASAHTPGLLGTRLGSRDRLSRAFLEDMAGDPAWAERGVFSCG